METFITVNGKDVAIIVEANEAASYVASQIEKLQKKIEALQEMNEDEQADEAVKSLMPKLKKIEAKDLLNEYTYAELKARAKGESLASYLEDQGIEKSLHGSAQRTFEKIKAAIEGLKLVGIVPTIEQKEAIIENNIGKRFKEWGEAVQEYAMNNL